MRISEVEARGWRCRENVINLRRPRRRVGGPERKSDIPHRLRTNNRRLEISYPGPVCLEIHNQLTLLYLTTGSYLAREVY